MGKLIRMRACEAKAKHAWWSSLVALGHLMSQCCCSVVNYNLVDPASSHMLVSKIKPCMSQYKLLYGETANGSLKQLQFI